MFSFVFLIHTIIVDLKNYHWIAYDEYGDEMKQGLASGGRRGFRTPHGTFNIIVKKGRYYKSTIYPSNPKGKIPCEGKACAPMPWYIKLQHKGTGIHASNVDKWNQPLKHISHSCIHTQINDAEWLNKNSNKKTIIVILPY